MPAGEMTVNQGWQSHRRHFVIIVMQAKFDAIMIWTNGFDFFCDNYNFFDAILSQFVYDYFLRFSMFSIIFLSLEKLAQTSYTQFLIKTKL